MEIPAGRNWEDLLTCVVDGIDFYGVEPAQFFDFACTDLIC